MLLMALVVEYKLMITLFAYLVSFDVCFPVALNLLIWKELQSGNILTCQGGQM